MKKYLLFLFVLLPMVSVAQSEIPYLKDGQLMVDGKPYIMLAGELHNSSTGSLQSMEGLWEKVSAHHVNTVIAAASWELCEPEEGQFDFTLVDAMIEGARNADLKLVLIWFGSWKNGTSTYVPSWVKTDQKRFPLARTLKGRKLNALSALSENAKKADARAFAALMRHLREIDGQEHTVLMVQVENEMGTLRDNPDPSDRASRDFSPMAQRAFKGQIPKALLQYLHSHEDSLHPALSNAWKSQGKRMKGTWEEVFGLAVDNRSISWKESYPYLSDELFNAWNYASYVGYVASAGKKEYPLPMFVNDWLKQRGQEEPGRYPSGAAQPHVFDIWKAAAPAIDFYAPDIYSVDEFDWVLQSHAFGGNPLFIPETDGSSIGASRALYAFGNYPLMGYSPFGLDGGVGLSVPENDASYAQVYGCLGHLLPEMLHCRKTGHLSGLFADREHPTVESEIDGVRLIATVESPYGRMLDLIGTAVEGSAASTCPLGVLVMQLDKYDYLIVGGVGEGWVRFEKPGARLAYLSVDRIDYSEQGNPMPHRLNGDEIYMDLSFPEGRATVYHVKLYEL